MLNLRALQSEGPGPDHGNELYGSRGPLRAFQVGQELWSSRTIARGDGVLLTGMSLYCT
jgi:hypothetical protein